MLITITGHRKKKYISGSLSMSQTKQVIKGLYFEKLKLILINSIDVNNKIRPHNF